MISGGAQEELSLHYVLEQVNQEVIGKVEAAGDAELDYDVLSKHVHHKLKSEGVYLIRVEYHLCF